MGHLSHLRRASLSRPRRRTDWTPPHPLPLYYAQPNERLQGSGGHAADLADGGGGEFLRLYVHYRFRCFTAEAAKKGKELKPATLDLTDAWTTPYFDGDKLETLATIRGEVAPALQEQQRP